MNGKPIPRPELCGEYIRIYTPCGDVYPGEDTESFKKGEFYPEWIANDFSIIRDGDTWHAVGITHPRPLKFKTSFIYEGDVHEGEVQLFHISATAKDFSSLLCVNSFTEHKKLLCPSERPCESKEIWAPQLLKLGEDFCVIYSPFKMRMAKTRDFEKWEIRELFSCKSHVARDPFVYFEDGVYYIIYTEEKVLKYRTTTDFLVFSEEKILQDTLFSDTECESPFLLKRDGIYYLFWSIWNGANGAYDERTLVFAADTLEGLRNTAPITMLRCHAPEIVTDSDGSTYLLSVFYPENGINAVKLKWV